MRRILALATHAACFILFAQLCHAQQTFPYKAHISADQVYVRSGPGQSYYPTDKLKLGQEVEVYRHDPGGWYAIRPVPNSFSWVSGRYLDVRDDGLAVVSEAGVAARVGSQLTDRRDVIQVRLREGEVVEILGKLEVPNGSGTTTWYKIAPPAGEFRWVFGKYVDPDYPVDGLRKTTQQPAAVESATVGAAGAQTAVQVAQSPGATGPGPVPGTTSAQGAAGWVSAQPAAGGPVSPGPAASAGSVAGASNAPAAPVGTFDDQVRQIETNLSMMVVADPAAWSFDGLRQHAEGLLSAAQTVAQRGRARVLLNKIVRFEDIKQRYLAIASLRQQTEQSNQYLSALSTPAARTGPYAQPDDRFDGTGQLTRVVSPKVGAPRYALLDEQGQVRCYVSPSPGVNLRHYLGQRVGVVGTRGYIPEQRAMHVMARHVHPLQGPTWR